jgi:molecular chaperone DnaJ
LVKIRKESHTLVESYYDILNIPETSSIEDIQKAYHKLAIKYHPDKSHSDANDFNRITKAYEILSDEEKRKEYDRKFEISVPRDQIGSDLRVSIKVKAIDIAHGIRKAIVIKRKEPCLQCAGTGSVTKKQKSCIYCAGTGYQGFPFLLGQRKRCSSCKGTGKLPDGDKCPNCKGSSQILKRVQHEIELNPYTDQITISGSGNYPIGKGKAGNLIVEVEIEQDPKYKIKGLNITGSVDISPVQAILGDRIELNVFNRIIDLNIPKGAQNQQIVEQEKDGISYDKKTGSFRATINIVTPTIISEKERSLYQELLEIEKTTEIKMIGL